MSKLTEKQQNFVNLIAQGILQGQAARLAGYAENSADVQATTLMKRADIKAAVKLARKNAGKPAEEPEVDQKSRLKAKYADPKSLMEDVMNNPSFPDGVRLQTAKDLLPYYHGKVGDEGKKEGQKRRAHEIAGGGKKAGDGRTRFQPTSPPKLVSVK